MSNNKDITQAPSPALRERAGERDNNASVFHRKSTYKARTLRQSQTEAEEAFWNQVKAKRFQGLKFKRQVPVGIYTVDFICIEEKIIIEIDGGQHNENAQDDARTKYLCNKGYKVIRFWNNEVLGNINGVMLSLSLTLSRNAGEGTNGDK